MFVWCFVGFFKQKTAYVMRISDWSSDVCSSDLGSMVATIAMLKKAGCVNIRALVLVAAPEGIAAVEAAHPDVHVYTASIDSHLNERGYIIPGNRKSVV